MNQLTPKARKETSLHAFLFYFFYLILLIHVQIAILNQFHHLLFSQPS